MNVRKFARRIARHGRQLLGKDRTALEWQKGRGTTERTMGARTRIREILESDLYFFESTSLTEEICPACDISAPWISAYPHSSSALFSPILTCWCKECGFGWVPNVPFDLADYYAKEYAKSNRGDRNAAPKAYFETLSGPEEEMRPHSLVRYARRAKRQQALLQHYVPEGFSLLEFGSGPGYGLFFSRARIKHAIEQDEASAKYLDHIGAKRLSLTSLVPNTYDAILSSHSLEHLTICTLYDTLAKLRAALKPDGVFYVEVPNGSLTSTYLPGNHSPHTLFFNLRSLAIILERAGFSILHQSAGKRKQHLPSLENPPHHSADVGQPGDAIALTVIAKWNASTNVPRLPPRPEPRRAAPLRS